MAWPSGQACWPVANAASEKVPRDQPVFCCPPDRRWAQDHAGCLASSHQPATRCMSGATTSTVASPSESLHAKEATLSDWEGLSSDCESAHHHTRSPSQPGAVTYCATGHHPQHFALDPGAYTRTEECHGCASPHVLSATVSGRGCEWERVGSSELFLSAAGAENRSINTPRKQHTVAVSATTAAQKRAAPQLTREQQVQPATPPISSADTASVPVEARQILAGEQSREPSHTSVHGVGYIASSGSCPSEAVSLKEPPDKVFDLQPLAGASSGMKLATQTVSLAAIRNEGSRRGRQHRIALLSSVWYDASVYHWRAKFFPALFVCLHCWWSHVLYQCALVPQGTGGCQAFCDALQRADEQLLCSMLEFMYILRVTRVEVQDQNMKIQHESTPHTAADLVATLEQPPRGPSKAAHEELQRHRGATCRMLWQQLVIAVSLCHEKHIFGLGVDLHSMRIQFSKTGSPVLKLRIPCLAKGMVNKEMANNQVCHLLQSL